MLNHRSRRRPLSPLQRGEGQGVGQQQEKLLSDRRQATGTPWQQR